MKLIEIDMGTTIGSPGYKTFNANGQCITHLLLIELGRYDNASIKKLSVTLTNDNCSPHLEVLFGNIGDVMMPFDFDSYWLLDSIAQKKRALFDALYKGIAFAVTTLSLDIEPFKKAKDAILADSLTTEFIWGRAKWNSSKSLKAQVFYRFNMEDIEIGVLIYAKSGKLVKEKVLAKTLPHFMFVEPLLGRLNWNDERHLALISKDKQERLSVSL
ncbi:MAG: hypothetical protein ACI8WB_005213 [Phenylobacterium sp.]|jgi:hypothetical protein